MTLITISDNVRQHIEDVCRCVIDTAGAPNIISIVMLGSGSRGELTYSNMDGLRMYGDYEFLIVTTKRPAKRLASDLREKLSDLPKKWGVLNPEFHIDFGLTTESRLRLLPRTLWTFETKNGGTVVYGSNVLDRFPVVTKENIDLGFLQELIFVRLWSIVSNMPDFRSEIAVSALTTSYLYARNVLDVLTILLPHRGTLVCGYGERMSCAETLLVGTEWEQDILLLRHCTEIKLNTISLAEARSDLGARCVELYKKLISEVFHVTIKDTAAPTVVGRDIWRYESSTRRARRKYLEVLHFVDFHKCSPAGYKIVTSDFVRPRLISILIDMATIGVSLSRGDNPPFSIDETIEKYEKLTGVSFSPDFSSVGAGEKWEKLRAGLLTYVGSWFFRRSPSHDH